MAHECHICGKRFDTKIGLGTHRGSVHGKGTPNRQCDHCGERFFCEYPRKYCSKECKEEAVSFAGENHPNWEGGKELTECEICDNEFEYWPSEKPGRFCSECVENEEWREPPTLTGEDHPYWKGGRRETECTVCEETVKRTPYALRENDVHFCSRDCAGEHYSEAYLGENHPNWQGGPSTDYRGDWREVRRRALERDGRRCVWCNKPEAEIGRAPDVHHIVPVRTFEQWDRPRNDAHRLGNLVSLCVRCHRRADFGTIPKRELHAAVASA